jgi:toxin ParE1/3/4
VPNSNPDLRVIFTPAAERQVDRLHEYITEHADENRADAYVARIVAFCEDLRNFPRRGRRRDDLLPGLRTIGFEHRATIAFVVTADAVLIEGIFYGGQDFEAALRKETRK